MKKLFLLVMIILGFNLSIKSSEICEKLFDKLQSLPEEESFKLNLFLNTLPPELNKLRSLVAAQDLQKAKKALEDIFELRNFPAEVSKEIIEYIKRNQLIEQVNLVEIIGFINTLSGILNKSVTKEEFLATCPKVEAVDCKELKEINTIRTRITNGLKSINFKSPEIFASFDNSVAKRLVTFAKGLESFKDKRQQALEYLQKFKSEKVDPRFSEVSSDLTDYFWRNFYQTFYTITGEPKPLTQDAINRYNTNTKRVLDFINSKPLLVSLKEKARSIPSLIEQGYAIICKL